MALASKVQILALIFSITVKLMQDNTHVTYGLGLASKVEALVLMVEALLLRFWP